MATASTGGATLTDLDDATRALVRASAVLAAGTDEDVRTELQRAVRLTPSEWMEELLLQTYLFAGFPRALNGTRTWRRIAGPTRARSSVESRDFRVDGERACAQVYGPMYAQLRVNIRELHPLLDEWMITEGYGKVLSRPELDLPRRELCIVAACAATGQDRQLQSHLHGARNVGVAERVISDVLESLTAVLPQSLSARAQRLWERIRNDVH
jgi:4-carboxymuconolactone decarboxylase